MIDLEKAEERDLVEEFAGRIERSARNGSARSSSTRSRRSRKTPLAGHGLTTMSTNMGIGGMTPAISRRQA
jgi:hypothetical protein